VLTPPNPPLIRGGKLPKNRHFPPLNKGGLGGGLKIFATGLFNNLKINYSNSFIGCNKLIIEDKGLKPLVYYFLRKMVLIHFLFYKIIKISY